jgi:hypothetical protein
LALELADQDTADLFIEVSRAIDKHLWFVEARTCNRSRGSAAAQVSLRRRPHN